MTVLLPSGRTHGSIHRCCASCTRKGFMMLCLTIVWGLAMVAITMVVQKSVWDRAVHQPAIAMDDASHARRLLVKFRETDTLKVHVSDESKDLLLSTLKKTPDLSELVAQQKKLQEGGSSDENEIFERHRPHRQAMVPPQVDGNEKLRAAREALPTFKYRSKIIKAVKKNQIIIIEGETGSGKTTQVGQYILEDATKKGEPCSVVCTQPRRISAISVSDRVADERGESLGRTVGYSVRQEHALGPDTLLHFCTTGILLRRLEHDTYLNGTTHVVVDEVHERSVESDFLLLALRDLSKWRPELKVILMSATLDQDLFARYFGGALKMTIPGRTFPVQDFFLEDALQITGHDRTSYEKWAKDDRTKSKEGGDDKDSKKRESLSRADVQKRYGGYKENVRDALENMDQDVVNYDLLVDLLKGDKLDQLAKSKPPPACTSDVVPNRPNSVLVFLSGAEEIETLKLELWNTEEYGKEPAKDWVLPLHGGLPTEDQKKVFNRPPPGVRKIVLATNVAETSITIDDIGYVVDTCRMKEMRFDAVRRMSSLVDTVVSRTNAKQRRGRAGRIAPGVAVHVGLTKFRHDKLVDNHQSPEVHRVPLEQLVLRIHATGIHLRFEAGKSASVCTQLMEPPDPKHVEKAVEELVSLGAIKVQDGTGKESLTTLGKHLANLPLEAKLGKLVLLGTAFGPAATDAALTVAAALTSRSPFLAPVDKREEAAMAKKSFASEMAKPPVYLSDHMAVVAAYRSWDQLNRTDGSRFQFCRENFLLHKSLIFMADIKQSLLETLSDAGFVAPGIRAKDVARLGIKAQYAGAKGSDGVLQALEMGKEGNFSDRVLQHEQKRKPCPAALLAGLLCAALSLQVARVTNWVATWSQDSGRRPDLVIRDATTGQPTGVKTHPSSVVFGEMKVGSPYFIYQNLVSTSQLFLRDVTPVSALALTLFGGHLAEADVTNSSYEGKNDLLLLDDWLQMAVPLKLGKPMVDMRQRLDIVFSSWLEERDLQHRNQTVMRKYDGAEVLEAVVKLLGSEVDVSRTDAPKATHTTTDAEPPGAKTHVQLWDEGWVRVQCGVNQSDRLTFMKEVGDEFVIIQLKLPVADEEAEAKHEGGDRIIPRNSQLGVVSSWNALGRFGYIQPSHTTFYYRNKKFLSGKGIYFSGGCVKEQVEEADLVSYQKSSNGVIDLAKEIRKAPEEASAVSSESRKVEMVHVSDIKVQELANFKARELVNTAWAFAKRGQSDVQLFVALAREAEQRMGDLEAHELADVTSALLKAGQLDAQLSTALKEQTEIAKLMGNVAVEEEGTKAAERPRKAAKLAAPTVAEEKQELDAEEPKKQRRAAKLTAAAATSEELHCEVAEAKKRSKAANLAASAAGKDDAEV